MRIAVQGVMESNMFAATIPQLFLGTEHRWSLSNQVFMPEVRGYRESVVFIPLK